MEGEFQLTEDTEDERFKTDTLYIIEEVLSRVSSEQSSDEARENDQQRVDQGVVVRDCLGVIDCPVEVGQVEETVGEDSCGGAGWQEVEDEEEEEEEEEEERGATETRRGDETLVDSPVEPTVEEEESPDEGINSDTSSSEGGVEEGVVNEEEDEGPVVEEDLSEKSEGFFEAIECRSEEYAKLAVGNGLASKKGCSTELDFGESESGTKIANDNTFTA